MRIGFFHATLPSASRKPGGVEVVVDRLARALEARGNTIEFWTTGADRLETTYRVHELQGLDRVGPIPRTWQVPLALHRIPTKGLDVLHLHGDDWFFVRRRMPTVRTFYGSAWREARSATSWKRRIHQASIAPLEGLSAALADASFGLTPTRTRAVLGIGVAARSISPRREADAPTVVFIGTWQGRKRGQLLAEEFEAKVLPEFPEARLMMISDDAPSRPWIDWYQRPTDVELVELLATGWVFCLPSRYEGFGVPYLEAMATGIPVIATENPGARYVLGNGAYGLIVDDHDLGTSLASLIRSPERRRRMERLGLERAREFTWDRVAQAHEAAYDAVVASNQR